MLIKFTIKSPKAGYELENSYALNLTLGMVGFQERLIEWLLERLHGDGFSDLSRSQLTFLGALDCGKNHASNLARTLSISRQAVHKTVRELENAGWLATDADKERSNQKVIEFTKEGERMMSKARMHFCLLDDALVRKFGKDNLEKVTQLIDFAPE